MKNKLKQQLVLFSFLVIALFVGGMVVSGCESWQPFTSTLTPTSTQTSTPTPTNMPTGTPTVTSTVDPAVTFRKSSYSVRLYPGPDINLKSHLSLDSETRVLVLGKIARMTVTGCGTWYKVQVEKTKEEGWVPCGFDTGDFDDSVIPYLQNVEIPSTDTPAPTPVLPRTVHITLVNQTEYAVEAYFNGPYAISVTIQPGKTKTVDLPAGSYYYELKSPGFVPRIGNTVWQEGFVDTWKITLK